MRQALGALPVAVGDGTGVGACGPKPAKASGWVIARGSGYQARWYDHDGRRKGKSFATKSEAKAFLKSQVEEVKKVRAGALAPEKPATVNALLDSFLEKHGRTVDPATTKNLTTQLRKARLTFGTRKPDSLRKAEIEDWQATLPEGSRHGVFRAFRQALTWASDPDRGLMERNPSTGIKNPKRRRHERKPVLPFESWEEVESIAAELDIRYRAIPIVAVGTGLRPEELFGLHRSDVEYFDNPKPGAPRGRIHVQRRYTQGMVKPGTKTEPERYVAFGQKVAEALAALPPRIDTPILFPAPRGGYIDIEKFRFREWTPGFQGN
jgi:integrase